MHIEEFAFTNNFTGWRLSPVSFGRMALLVGASGVGKTRILRSILDTRKIARGDAINGVEWRVRFRTAKGSTYEWSGEYENRPDAVEAPPAPFAGLYSRDESDKPKILWEKLLLDGQEIIQRDSENILFENVRTVKLSQTESVISLLKEEGKIRDAHRAFGRIIYDDNTGSVRAMGFYPFDEEEEEKIDTIETIDKLRESNEDLRFKLYALYKKFPDDFSELAQTFSDVFPYVEDVKVEALRFGARMPTRMFSQTPLIQLKEKFVDGWVDEFRISSGMLRTFTHMAELYLCADSTLILIDEFENSLGINCIDEITTSILTAERDTQFILTSHHPYIINQIEPRHWKLVTRRGGDVKTQGMDKFNLSESKHEAFTQLMNLEAFEEGVDI